MRSDVDLKPNQIDYIANPVMLTDNDSEIYEETVKSDINVSLRRFFAEAVRVSLKNPGQAFKFFRIVRYQMKAAKIRSQQEKQGVHVPPIIIYSVTNRCNLHCKGCYHQALHQFPQTELSDSDMRRVIGEAKELGVSFLVIAGGEPMVRTGLLDVIAANPEIIFFVFTNGTLIDDGMIARFKKQRNFVPLISIEGMENETDDRRGHGVYNKIKEVMAKLHRAGIFFGTSLTVTRSNYSRVTEDKFVKDLSMEGCKLFLYAEYTPVREGTADWIITEQQRLAMPDTVNHLRRIAKALFVSVPGD
ncbi:MAG TPA: radical SAM protein [Dehalococcoidales bacterium]|nr:radical SAM protein [Dehalococcoidales bacterium]